MTFSVLAFLLATAVLFVKERQILGAPTAPQDDPAYKLFEIKLQSQKLQAEYKLYTYREIYVNNTKYFNIPEFDLINSSLSQCFEDAKATFPDADPFCLDVIGQEVQQTISDSKQELYYCTNLTHSWELIHQLLEKAEEAITYLDKVVTEVLEASLNCVTHFRYNPRLKNLCFISANGSYSAEWTKATSLTQEAYFQMSGGGLLLGAEVLSCQQAESFSLTEKCEEVLSEIKINCVLPPHQQNRQQRVALHLNKT